MSHDNNMAAPVAGLSVARPLCQFVLQRRRPIFILTNSMTRMTPALNKEFIIKHADQVRNQQSQTLVLMFGFYGASEKAIQKYSNIYHSYGFDVLPVKSYLRHFSWPKYSCHLANQTLTYLHENCLNYDNILVHAFSMGAFNFVVCFATMHENKTKHDVIENKICGIVYDSLAIGSLEGMISGIASGISTNQAVRWVVPKAMNTFYYITHKDTVEVYDHYLDFIKKHPPNVPTLIFYSKNDQLSSWDVIEEYMKEWRNNCSFPVKGKLWVKSKHAAHLMVHEAEYRQTLDNFVKSVPCLAEEIKIHSKM